MEIETHVAVCMAQAADFQTVMQTIGGLQMPDDDQGRGDEDTEGDASLEAQLVNTAQGYAPRAIEPTLYSISLEKQKFNEVMERSGGLISRGL